MFGIPASGRCAAAIAGAALLWAASPIPASAAVILLIGPAANSVDTSPASVATINTAAGGTIQDIDISIQITGGHMEDWTLELEHLGTVVLLRADKTNPFIHIDAPFDVTFDDEAPSAIGTNNNGTYQPEGSLAAFDGLALAGAWNLRILDTFTPNEGDDLIAWSITATVADVPEPATFALFGLGLAGLGLARRRRAS